MRRKRINSFTRIAMMTAVLEAVKFALNAFPNVELVTLSIIVFTRRFGWKETVPACLLFAIIECFWWGFGTWSMVYFVIWPFLVLLTTLLPLEGALPHALLSGFFGLGFGAFCALFTLAMAGLNAAIAWWITGIPYDLVHGIANFIVALFLFKPLMKAMEYIPNQ